MTWLGRFLRKLVGIVDDVGAVGDKLVTEACAVFQTAHDKLERAEQLYDDKVVELHEKLADLADEADKVGLDVQATVSAKTQTTKQLAAVREFLG